MCFYIHVLIPVIGNCLHGSATTASVHHVAHCGPRGDPLVRWLSISDDS